MERGCSAGAVLSSIRTVAETGSTNADMLAAARAGEAEGAWLRAERQMAGRGRLGRGWQSPGGNLYASTLVRLRASDLPAPSLALMAGVALVEAVSVFWDRHEPSATSSVQPSTSKLVRGDERCERQLAPQLKWPNDLLIEGAKVAGILLEGVEDAVVIGVGVNLAHYPELPDRPATSLCAHGVEVSPAALLDPLAESFARWLARWRGEGLAPIRARWLERAHRVGTALTVRLPDGSATDGLFDGLDADGALILRLPGGERRVVHAGDVFLI